MLWKHESEMIRLFAALLFHRNGRNNGLGGRWAPVARMVSHEFADDKTFAGHRESMKTPRGIRIRRGS